ncbi:MAG: DUF3800 domain-containing protein [Hyphomicrobiales bacterium]
MVLAFPPPDVGYIAYIDESGDPGIKKVFPIAPDGASEWFTLGAIVVQAERSDETVDWVKDIRERTKIKRPDLHFAHMSDWQRAISSEAIAALPLKCFTVVSNKKNMMGYTNPRAEAARGASSNETFYNFCARVLLERVTEFVLAHSMQRYGKPKHLQIIFSDRGGMRYSQTVVYFDLLANQARSNQTFLKAREIKWEVIHPKLIEAERHEKSAGLQLTDTVASAFCFAADAEKRKPHVTQHAEALKYRMWHKQNVYAGNGVTFLPWKIAQAKLTESQKLIFRFCGYGV